MPPIATLSTLTPRIAGELNRSREIEASLLRRLRDNPDPPCWQFAQGNLAALNSPAKAAIVGSRDARTTGIDTARQRAGLVVYRGLGIASVSAPR